MTYFTMLNTLSSMKFAPKSVPGLPDAGVPQEGDEDGPRTPPRCLEGVRKKLEMTNSFMPNNVSSMKDSLKSVPGLAEFGVPHGVKDGPRTPAPGSGSKITAYYVDQHKKLKGWDV